MLSNWIGKTEVNYIRNKNYRHFNELFLMENVLQCLWHFNDGYKLYSTRIRASMSSSGRWD